MKIIDSLEGILPKTITENTIVKYDRIKEYKIIYSRLIKELDRGNSEDASDFLRDDFIDVLRKYFPLKNQINLNRIKNMIENLLIKWLIRKRGEYAGNDEKFNELFETVQLFDKQIIYKSNHLCKFQNRDFAINPGCLGRNLRLECIYQWDSLLSKLKSIYRDFYQNNYDCESIIKKYFQGNFNADPLLQFAIKYLNIVELKACFHKQHLYYKLSQSYSNVDFDKKVNSKLLIKMRLYEIENDDDDIVMTIRTGNKIEIFDFAYIKPLLERYERLDLLNEKYIPSSLLLHDKNIDLEYILFNLQEAPCDEELLKKFKKLQIKE